MKTFTVMAVIFATILAFTGRPALAFHCPKDIAANWEAIAAAGRQGVDQKKIEEAKKLNDEARKLHETGKHQESIEKAAAAKKALGA